MALASLFRGRGAVFGAVALAGLIGLIRLAEASQPPRGKQKGAQPAVKAHPAPKLTIVSPGSDVPEMAKLINNRLEEGWKANKVTPSAYIDDHTFIRRASLDIIGRIATPDEIRQYLKDPADKRRSMLVERLLKSDDYPQHWGNLWGNWLLTRAGDFGRGDYHYALVVWLQDQFANNRPYHEIVTKLLTATGKNLDRGDDKMPFNGATNFILAHLGEPIRVERNPRETQKRVEEEGHFEMVPLTSRVTRVFLGTQVQCAQCHAHPFFGSLKQEMFWGVNAFLRQVRRDGAPTGRRPARMAARPVLSLSDDTSVNRDPTVYFELRSGKVKMWHAEFLPASGKERGPKLDPRKQGLARREELARHVVEHDMFAKAIVNRMWGLFLGRGFVNPIDDFNDNNQPSNPELLNELADRFKHYNYDLKKLIRWITHSNAYQLSHVANKTNDKVEHEALFARMNLKALTPEQLFESLLTATGSGKGVTPDAKKKLEQEWLGQLITNFGDDEGNEVTFNGTIVQALLLMNGRNINDAISSPNGTVATTLKSPRARSAAGMITELYLAALNREPRPAELKGVLDKVRLRAEFARRDSLKAQAEDLYWGLLNSNEFLLNH